MNGCILVFGMPRSGTTTEWDAAPQYRRELHELVAELSWMRSSEVAGKRPLFPKSYQSIAALGAYCASVVVKAASRVKGAFSCPSSASSEAFA